MRLLEEVEVNLERLDLEHRQPISRPDRPPARAAGIHLSGVLRHTVRTSRMPGWDKYIAELDAKKYPLIWFMGVCWEEGCVSLYPDCIWQPYETKWCGVSMNCDGHSLLPEGFTIEEFKYTSCARRSWAEFKQDWLKMQQGVGYCGGYGARLVRWHVLYNRQPWNPVYVRFLVEMEESDVVATRQMVESNRDGAIAAGYGEE
jgi:hypothetical protein